ncbi:MAG: hypothetical protein GSR85_00260 [Desulfurococcales archaeon]|nr:hypothetical protein [Desulfurococcales archaeon]
MHRYRVLFEAHWPLVFREPGLFDATVHGPSTAGRSLLYPQPSTIAGALASLFYDRDILDGCDEDSVFWDQECVLGKSLGSKYRIFSGYAVADGGEVYIYTGTGFTKIEPLRKGIREVLDRYKSDLDSRHFINSIKRANKCGRSTALFERIGIALDRRVKAAREGYLYILQHVDYVDSKGRFHPAIYIEAEKEIKATGGKPLFLGGERRITLYSIHEAERPGISDFTRSKDLVAALLISPAILKNTPLEEVNMVSVSSTEKLAKELLNEAGLLDKFDIADPYLVQTSGQPIEAVNAGWSMAMGMLREPVIIVPPGTILLLRPRKSDAIEELYSRGVGSYTWLGWGTVDVI